MLCKTIAEKGWKCPNLGKCKCKSPAGLAYIPMETKEVRKHLAACKVTLAVADDVNTAQKFIEDYLYNYQSGIAEAFINHEIKAKFNFKAAEVKQLLAFYKEINREYSSTREAHKTKTGVDLPHWYELTEKGGWRFMPSVLADELAENANVIYVGENYSPRLHEIINRLFITNRRFILL